jgi:hypothetical protein
MNANPFTVLSTYGADSVRACWGWPCCSRPASGADGRVILRSVP